MAENSLLSKLEGLESRFEEVSTLITDPAVIADQNRYVRLTKEYKDLGDIMEARKKYVACLNVIKEAKFNLKDSTLKEPFMGDIEVTPSVATDTFEVAVFPDANFKPVFKIETSDNKQYIFTAPGGKKIEILSHHC